jgi:hypothetical protein
MGPSWQAPAHPPSIVEGNVGSSRRERLCVAHELVPREPSPKWTSLRRRSTQY